uniref:AIG1-type G domain-containing protein n=1 Tax=Picocystis salinarum TaxID=88271 RepID=A0A7S3UFQ3_9CHLO|eukprot:CAMPEP_0183824448 /NCGR_PEP_ID=MMETSP0807_2-20130328/587_1 /TAXON_ID=88271 /ORGANISM="Picocystis salinarum, Strain CCMP1897" /LENGTH=852 /DNA_ID=CAMNT_0026069375 /DNA_START=137 /DNA_END=2695 /DNA_ORIENTATION=-
MEAEKEVVDHVEEQVEEMVEEAAQEAVEVESSDEEPAEEAVVEEDVAGNAEVQEMLKESLVERQPDAVKEALLSLNMMATRTMSLSTAILEGITSETLASRVKTIAEKQPAPPSNEQLDELIERLQPLVPQVGRKESNAVTIKEETPKQATGGAMVAAEAKKEATALSSEVNGTESELQSKLLAIRVKLLRLAKRLGQSPRHSVVAQVLYRLELAEQLRLNAAAGKPQMNQKNVQGFERANDLAQKLEAEEAPLDLSCTILLLGRVGVGKSTTIQELIGESNTPCDAFTEDTKHVCVTEGNAAGIHLRFIDTPGLQVGLADSRYNRSVLQETKKITKKYSPDIVLYFDRMDDVTSKGQGDLPLVRCITDVFGGSIWYNAILCLTHGATLPPDGPNGAPLGYDMFLAQRSHVVQQTVRQAAGDMRLMNPVALVENHPRCRTNADGEKLLPNGQAWKPQLLLLCLASKMLADANVLLSAEDKRQQKLEGKKKKKAAGFLQRRVPPLPYLLSNLLTSRAPKKPHDEEEFPDEDELQEMPARQQRQWRKRMREYKQMIDEEKAAAKSNKGGSQIAVPAPEPALPPSFDGESSKYRFRMLESPNMWIARPIVDQNGWDHETGIEGFSIEKPFTLRRKNQYWGGKPLQVTAEIAKDKKDMSFRSETEVTLKHSKKLSTVSGIDSQSIGRDMAYTARSETRYRSKSGRNKMIVGLSASRVVEAQATGFKVEERLKVLRGSKVKSKVVLAAGMVKSGSDKAKGANTELTVKAASPDDPFRLALGGSLMQWRGDLAKGGNVSLQKGLGDESLLSMRANLNSRGQGQITTRISSNSRMELAFSGIVPLFSLALSRLRNIGSN